MIATAWRKCILLVLIGFDIANGEVTDTPAAVIEATLCADGKVPEATSQEIRAESEAVFRAAGISLRLQTSRERDCATSGVGVLRVRLENSPVRAGASESRAPVASIQFIDGRPDRTITLSVSAARYLLRRDPATRSLLARVSGAVEHRWIGRMLGRALAHELGHYVLQSPLHSASGLMRATHTVPAFVDPARAAFRLAPVEREALLSRLRAAQRAGAAVDLVARE